MGPGGATDGSQGWSEHSERNPWRASQPSALQPRRGDRLRVAPPGLQIQIGGLLSKGSAALHPWLPSVAPSGLQNQTGSAGPRVGAPAGGRTPARTTGAGGPPPTTSSIRNKGRPLTWSYSRPRYSP